MVTIDVQSFVKQLDSLDLRSLKLLRRELRQIHKEGRLSADDFVELLDAVDSQMEEIFEPACFQDHEYSGHMIIKASGPNDRGHAVLKNDKFWRDTVIGHLPQLILALTACGNKISISGLIDSLRALEDTSASFRKGLLADWQVSRPDEEDSPSPWLIESVDCEWCGEPINPERVKAKPDVVTCIKCSVELQRRNNRAGSDPNGKTK